MDLPTVMIKVYSDVLYVSELIAPDVINTMPEQTLLAFAQHGQVARTLDSDSGAAEREMFEASAHGIDLEAVARELEEEGLRAFEDSYRQITSCLEHKLAVLVPAG